MANPSIKTLVELAGDRLIEYLKMRQQRLDSQNLKKDNEFETIWNAAEIEGRRKELSNIIEELNKY